MTKDYAKPSSTRSSSKAKASKSKAKSSKTKTKASPTGATAKPQADTPPSSKGPYIVLLILLLAGSGYGLYKLQQVPVKGTATLAPKVEEPQVQAKTKEPTPNKASPQRFEFYDILPDSEVVPPKVEEYKFKEKNTGDEFYYLVQTGSFRSEADAGRQKATIAFKGLKAKISVVEGSNGSTWYRVTTGPFYTRSAMNSALDKLVALNIQPLVKKIKK